MPAASAFPRVVAWGRYGGRARSDPKAVVCGPIHRESGRHTLSPLTLASGYPHAQHRLRTADPGTPFAGVLVLPSLEGSE
jgi:hypothetical protein